MTPQDEEIATLRETNQRLNRRCQLAEAAANLKVEDWGKRSQKHGRAYIFQMGVDFGKEQAEAARDHLRARLQLLIPYAQHAVACDLQHAGERWEPEYKRQYGRWWGAWVPDSAVIRSCTCGLADLLAILTEPEEKQ